MNQQLRVLLIKEGGANWVAQCLEYDIAAQGGTIKEALKSFDETLVSELVFCAENNLNSLEDIAAAPNYYWRLFDEAAEQIVAPKREPLMPLLKGFFDGFTIPDLRELRAA